MNVTRLSMRRAQSAVAKALFGIHRTYATRSASVIPKRVRSTFDAIKARARKKGLQFDLTYAWLNAKYQGVCEATGISFGVNSWQPTVDRRDNTKGYTMDNCWMVCWIYNRAKGDGSIEDLMLLARTLVQPIYFPAHR